MPVALLDPAPTETTEFDPFNPPPPEEADERARLIRALQLTDRFALFVATCNRADVRHEIVAQIKAENPDLRLVEITVDRNVPNLLAYLSTLPDVQNADGVFVSGVESFLPNTEEVAHSSFVVNLNGTRDAFPKTLSCPLVLWLADYARNGVMQGAPDFYSVRSASFVFASLMPSLPEIQQLVANTGYSASWQLSFEDRKSYVKELNDLLTQLQSLPDAEQEHPAIFFVSEKLAGTYTACGQYDDAELIMRHLVAESTRLFGQTNPVTLSTLINWADLCLRLGQTTGVEKAIKQGILLIANDSMAEDRKSAYTAHLKDRLGGIYQVQNKITEAAELFKEALSIKEMVFGVESKEVAITINNLSINYYEQNRFSDAKSLLDRAVRLSRQYLGASHPSTLSALNNLGAIFYKQGDIIEAEKIYMDVLKIQQASLGMQHPDVAISLNNMAVLRLSQGRLQDAQILYKQAEEIYKKVFGLEHPHTKLVRQSILRLSERIGTKKTLQPMQMKPNKKHKHTSKKV